MSGPKVDIAEIRNQEAKRLENLRKQRLELADYIRGCIAKVDKCTNLNSSLEYHKLQAISDKIGVQQRETISSLQKLINQVKLGNEMLDMDRIKNQADALMRHFGVTVQDDVVLMNDILKNDVEYKQMQQQSEKMSQLKRKQIIILSSENENSEEVITEKIISEMHESFENEIKDFINSDAVTSKHKNIILSVSEDLKNIMESDISLEKKEKRIKRLFEEYQKIKTRAEREMSEMKEVYNELIKESFDMTINIPSVSEFSSVKEIEEAIEAMKIKAKTCLSKEYIRRQIDEVMSKHGYDVVRSDILEQTADNGQVLYGVNENTAINVFVSDENQVTMRVVGIGFDSDISASEDERLFEQQCAFCSMHPQITAELAMRGVILHTKHHMPPDKKFNKKVKVHVKSSTQTTSRAKKELKRQELKKMHKE